MSPRLIVANAESATASAIAWSVGFWANAGWQSGVTHIHASAYRKRDKGNALREGWSR